MRDKVAGLSKEGESIALSFVHTELGTFLLIVHDGNVDQVVLRECTLFAILVTSNVLVYFCKIGDYPKEKGENHNATRRNRKLLPRYISDIHK